MDENVLSEADHVLQLVQERPGLRGRPFVLYKFRSMTDARGPDGTPLTDEARLKTDREDARWLRELLSEGRLPESWIPPEHVRQWRTRARLRKTLVDERTAWHQRIRATLYHHGISGSPEHLSTLAGREFLAKQALPIDATERITIALEMIDLLEIQIARVESEIRKLARRQTGCKALMTLSPRRSSRQ